MYRSLFALAGLLLSSAVLPIAPTEAHAAAAPECPPFYHLNGVWDTYIIPVGGDEFTRVEHLSLEIVDGEWAAYWMDGNKPVAYGTLVCAEDGGILMADHNGDVGKGTSFGWIEFDVLERGPGGTDEHPDEGMRLERVDRIW